MENIIANIKHGCNYEFARKIADEHEQKTGNRCLVKRIIDFRDRYDGEIREHFSFDVIEIIDIPEK